MGASLLVVGNGLRLLRQWQKNSYIRDIKTSFSDHWRRIHRASHYVFAALGLSEKQTPALADYGFS